jgi:hypothetical protein
MKLVRSLTLLAILALALTAAPAPAQHVGRFGGTPITTSSGNVAAATATATLPAVASKTTYICGFTATGGGATAAATVNLTVTNIVTGTMTYNFGVPAGVDAPATALNVVFNPCMPANAIGTTIVVSMPSLGAGNAHASINASGYQY